MPLSHRKLSSWYDQFARQLEAGLYFSDALRTSRGVGAPGARLESMATRIEEGGSIDDALRVAGSWMPFEDKLFISAAADSGRLPQILHTLSTRHAQLSTAQRRLTLACAYPLAVLHLGLLLLPVTRMIDWEKGFTWDTTAYAQSIALTLLPIWLLGAGIWILARRRNTALNRISRLIPVVGRYVREQALADFCFALGNFLEAGQTIEQAWAAAGLIAHSAELKNAADDAGALIAEGVAPGSRMERWPCFPPDFKVLYRNGESSGQLDQNLLRLADQHREHANRALATATVLYPALLFFAVAGAVVYNVISVYGGYLAMIGKLAE